MLKSIHIQHYKSLSDIRIYFNNVNVLVGQNATGKSNIIDALRFIKDAYTYDLDHAITDRGGIEVLRQYSPTKPFMMSISVDFNYQIPGVEAIFPASYSLKLSSSKAGYKVDSEYAEWSERLIHQIENNKFTHVIQNFIYERDVNGKVTLNGAEIDSVIPSDQLGIRLMRRAKSIFDGAFTQMRFASMFPNTLRIPTRPDQDRRLKEDCSNWASVIKAMRQRKQDAGLQRVISYMSKVIPGLQNVTVKTAGGYLVPQFLVQDRPDSRPHYYDALQLSDGTLRLFGMLLTLYQSPQPTFIAMEEPEQMVHPGILNLFVDAIREVSTRSQVMLTTHSPYLLDLFKAEEIRVVYLRHGETRVSSIRHAQVKMTKDGLMRLSEIMSLDGLQPQE
ncbi:MAG TPA: AAA family ATPase [Gammaproteobacteria bacterium]|jgi:predicted ATPase|nr:AAA family ATPase [Gammaproteobacteria bacterium]